MSHRAGCAPEYTRVAAFADVEAIRTFRGNCDKFQTSPAPPPTQGPAIQCKGVLQLRVRAAQDTLALTCPSIEVDTVLVFTYFFTLKIQFNVNLLLSLGC